MNPRESFVAPSQHRQLPVVPPLQGMLFTSTTPSNTRGKLAGERIATDKLEPNLITPQRLVQETIPPPSRPGNVSLAQLRRDSIGNAKALDLSCGYHPIIREVRRKLGT
jgi:hypothetical protein